MHLPLSGGLDSLAGVKWALDRKHRPILISHPAMSLVSWAQKDLVTSLNQIMADKLEWYQIRATPKPGMELESKEYTQRSRSFLYLTLGAMFAVHLGIRRIYIFENGIIAMNIPLTQSRIYNNTRTVHPKFLFMYQELLNSLFGSGIEVENPFQHMTKGEVVKVLDADGYRELVKTTISCSEVSRLWHQGVKTRLRRHCGVCLPCVFRRFSMHYANLWDYDAKYVNDIVGEFSKLPEEGRTMLFEIMDFARRLEACATVEDATHEIPEFYIEGVDPAPLVEMTKRHLVQVKECLAQRGSSSLKQSLHLV